MRKLISNSTNIPLTKNETKKVIAKAAALSVLGLGLSYSYLRNMARIVID